jgi:hypothetical protein
MLKFYTIQKHSLFFSFQTINSNHLTISNKTVCNKLANNLDGEEYEVYEKKKYFFLNVQ